MRRIALLTVALATTAVAQDRPPRLLRVAPLPRPASETREAIEVRVVVDAQGHATLEACDAPPSLCASAEIAIANGQFGPASRDGAPIAARVTVRLVLADAEPAAQSTAGPSTAGPSTAGPSTAGATPLPERRLLEAPPPEELGVTALVATAEEGARRIALDDARDMPGALGDPLRAALAFPGVVPLFEGLPFFYLRGAPPAGTVFYYDSIPLPALFHLGPGASVVHPRMLGDIQIVSGVPSARYGRLSGGLIVGDGPPPLSRDFVAEAEARLTDVSAYAHGRAGDVEASIAARYGFPGLIASAFVPSLDIQFADYQLRAQLRLDRTRRLELVGLGSFDLFASNSYVGFQVLSYATTTLLFHRGELRYVESRGDMEAGIALRVGHDRGTNEDASTRLEVDAVGAGARAWMAFRQGTFRLRVGTEHYANTGEIAGPPVAHPILGLAAGRRGRTTMAVYGELTWQPWPELEIAGGTRADVYIDPGALYASADPRLRVEWRPDRALSVHGAAGLTHQPSIYVLPLPALNELPARPGLQNVAQSEIGATIRARHEDVEVTVDVRGYLHRFENMVVEDFIDTGILRFCDSSLSCRDFEGDVRLGWTSWGAELDARASLGRHVSARVAYTLGFLDADPLLGFVEYTPSQDVQHILHTVIALDTGVGLTVGLRGFLRSGEVRGFNRLDPIRGPIRTEHRLPWWGRLDAMIAFAWDAGWARLRASLDWANVLFALGGPPIDLVCDGTDTCTLRTGPAIPLPSLGLRGTFQ